MHMDSNSPKCGKSPSSSVFKIHVASDIFEIFICMGCGFRFFTLEGSLLFSANHAPKISYCSYGTDELLSMSIDCRCQLRPMFHIQRQKYNNTAWCKEMQALLAVRHNIFPTLGVVPKSSCTTQWDKLHVAAGWEGTTLTTQLRVCTHP